MSNEVVIFNSEKMDVMLRLADIMSKGVATIPKHFQGNPSDCLAVVLQAARWNMDPYAVSQKTHLINGALGYEAQLVNAVVSSGGAIEGRFHYEYGGEWKSDKDDSSWIRVGAILRGEDEITWGERIYPAKVSTKNSGLWKTNPKQQAAYLAVKYWARLYCPEAILGIYTPEDLRERPVERDITPGDTPVSALKLPEPEQEAVAEVAPNPGPAYNVAAVVKHYHERMSKAKDADALNLIGRELGKEPEAVKDMLRGPFTDRMADLSA